MEMASLRGVDRTRYVSLQDNAVPLQIWIGYWRCGKKGSGIGMDSLIIENSGGRQFDDSPQVHDRNPGAEMFNDRQVMGDKQISQPEFLLEFLEKVDDLGLDGNIQCRYRLVADKESGIEGQGSGDADTLPLSP